MQVTLLPPEQRVRVEKCYRQWRYPTSVGRRDRVFTLTDKTDILAAVVIQPREEGWQFLRSMCVCPERRRLGLGARLLDQVAEVLREESVYCYPFDHLQELYAAHDFIVAEPVRAPTFIRDTLQSYRESGRRICLMVNGTANRLL